MKFTALNEDEKKICQLFVEHANYVRSHSLVQQRQLKINTKITCNKGETIKVEKHEIPHELLESFLVRLRKFNNQNDMIYLPAVVNILLQYENDNNDIEFLRESKKCFLNKQKYQLLKMEHQGEKLTEGDLFDLYVNGKIFHANPQKAEKLDSIKFGIGYSYDMFLCAIIAKARSVLAIDSYIGQKFALQAKS